VVDRTRKKRETDDSIPPVFSVKYRGIAILSVSARDLHSALHLNHGVCRGYILEFRRADCLMAVSIFRPESVSHRDNGMRITSYHCLQQNRSAYLKVLASPHL